MGHLGAAGADEGTVDDKIEVLASKVLLVEGLLARLLVNQRQVHLLQFFGVVSGRTK